MIDQRHFAIQRKRAGRAIGRHQRAVAAPHPPVDLGVLVGVHVEDRDAVELAAVDVGRDRIDHRIPAIAGFETGAGGAVAAASGLLRGLLGAVVEGVERGDEVGALVRRECVVKGLLAPRRPGLVDLEIQLLGDPDEGILVGRMQPAAAEVEGDVGRGHDGVARPPTRSRASSTITERPEFSSARAAPRPAAPAPMMATSTSEGRDMKKANSEWRIANRV